ncbi:hypothetical protein LEP1GSC021_0347 [Leptospira noguchii str. 1993005606]|uniref:Uncharacterized protein n=3 Tax=Leptospira noguchii TaxID=28182 RepID=M6Y6M3_9LEPT|nr:hypothetical protein LEP1GSC041_2805 [Leptospira noguchii str. 2006001870]EMI72691.1 hypothetical protein LEP1GSC072_2573 [Leptospira noguchii str. Bonito]EMM98524.1 hypothetical protein LEP1GSC035_2597 [Leptospira noguchii str. 2007001578]EMO26862.1 hypothetical protein LEP1GSC170_3518 [Leptospira interrogans serovar Bataviae str. HAI135]EMO38815.1 hypothetical protein LEP1GSC186_2903 [Leptospira noguchii serovar Autumnalis str. ZUN142]EMO89987.1 hypothetical protein LEP1GSC024_4380 [Lepto
MSQSKVRIDRLSFLPKSNFRTSTFKQTDFLIVFEKVIYSF